MSNEALEISTNYLFSGKQKGTGGHLSKQNGLNRAIGGSKRKDRIKTAFGMDVISI